MSATLERPVIDVWRETKIEPLTMLEDLRNMVLERSTTRMPKWKFRLADDLVVQIQPKQPEHTRKHWEQHPWFDCLAVFNAEPTIDMIKNPTLRFKLRYSPQWYFKIIGMRNDGSDHEVQYLRLLELLPNFKRLTPRVMFTPSCLMCGKALTDPVSRARWIGPECAGTASAALPYIYNLETQ